MATEANTVGLDNKPLSVYFVMGEMSGDNLGDDLLKSFADLDIDVVPTGLGGDKMKARGLETLFDISEIAVMGLSGVIAKLPSLYKRVRQTVEDIVTKKPDVVLLVDSPEFGYAVAKRVRAQAPDIPFVKYVCPTVWAWRPGRAPKLRRYVDHILSILPFEPELLEELGGPKTTYIGHPLMSLIDENADLDKTEPGDPVNLVVLPGSRKSEVTRLMPVIRETLEILVKRGNTFEATLPAVPHLADLISSEVANWPVKPNVVFGESERARAFRQADAAIAASGTVTLELALYKTPMVAIYKLDPVMMQAKRLFTAWTASLPNLIADSAIVPEQINEFAHPQLIARIAERLMKSGLARRAQLDGFAQMANNMRQDELPGVMAARILAKVAADRTAVG